MGLKRSWHSSSTSRDRNRVEFRSNRTWNEVFDALVEIETEWNLDELEMGLYHRDTGVEIETEWNLDVWHA